VSRYKVCGEQVASQGIVSFKRAKALSRYIALQICLGSRNKRKNRDKQLTFIVRVSISCYFNFIWLSIVSFNCSIFLIFFSPLSGSILKNNFGTSVYFDVNFTLLLSLNLI